VSEPALSVVCLASPYRERTRRCLHALGSQTALGAMELILLDSGSPQDLPEPPDGLATRVERMPRELRLGAARAQGVRAARAPAVAFISDHCYPDPGWAQALIDAYREHWAAVGYVFDDSAGTTYGARAARIADHGQWLYPVARGGAVESVSYGEASYRRDFLDGLGQKLEWTLDSDFSLQSRVHETGLSMGLAPGAVITHDNLPTVLGNALLSYHSSRLVGARHLGHRGRSTVRRLLYALAAPLAVPLLRTLRLVRDTRGRVPRGQLATALPAIVVKNVFEGFGQAHGYLRGEGDAAARVLDAELRWPRAGA
jgi:GT2 family glycosyltransferase